MGYTNSIDTMKWWELNTKRLKYFSTEKFDEHNNKVLKGRPPSELITGTIFFTLPTIKIDLSDHPFIKYDIFEVNVIFPPRGTPFGIFSQ